MSKDINMLIIEGVASSTPDIEEMQFGKTSRFFIKNKSKFGKNESELTIKIESFDQVADYVFENVKEGDRVTAFGKLKYRQWIKDGKQCFAFSVHASKVRITNDKKEEDKDEQSYYFDSHSGEEA